MKNKHKNDNKIKGGQLKKLEKKALEVLEKEKEYDAFTTETEFQNKPKNLKKDIKMANH